MDIHEPTTLYEVEVGSIRRVYVMADSRHEVVQTIGERYDDDRFNYDWRDYNIIQKIEKSPKRAIEAPGEPFTVLYRTEDRGVRGLEKRANMAGSKGLYWI